MCACGVFGLESVADVLSDPKDWLWLGSGLRLGNGLRLRLGNGLGLGLGLRECVRNRKLGAFLVARTRAVDSDYQLD